MSRAAGPARDPWLTVDVRHLTALATVARLRSFAGAAAVLGYGPSAVSSQIAYLEGIAGCRLFERSGTRRESTPTPAGAALLEHVEQILETLNRARAEVDVLTASPLAGLSIGRIPLLADRLAGVFTSQLDGDDAVRIEPSAVDATDALLGRVARGELDAAFVELPIAQGPFSSVELVREPRFLAVPADAPELNARATVQLTGIVRIRDCRGTDALVRGLPRSDVPQHVVDTPAAALAFVRAGVAAAVMTRSDAGPENPAVRFVEDPTLPPRVIGLTWHRARDGDPALGQVAELARRSLATLA